MASEADYRLPRTVIPSHYEITIEPDLDAATFSGLVVIDVDVTDPVTEIVLNTIELDILSAKVVSGDSTFTPQVSLDGDAQRLTLTVGDTVAPGPAKLSIAFTGILNDKLHGFYRSTYTTPDGESKTIATTQFEATDARRAFPCWDEPDLKATYAIHLIVDPDLMAVSNAAEVARTETASGKVEVSFARTMKMSTYLVAFIVGDLEATDPIDVDGTPLRIIVAPDSMHLTPFALEMGAHALGYFSSYYGIPYPGDKLDMIAIPDFAWGAMENLGCITYRETALLLDESTATNDEKIRVADVIAHEIAHMWFGDLVTMKWWNGIWLNEAFATFAEVKCVDAFDPAWDRWLSFSASRSASQQTDALASTRSIEVEVASPEEANAMFDVLTYQKGSSVLRMLEQYLGEEVFRAGVTRYLEAHAYANTETADLWDALETESGEPVGEIMDTWIFQGGYPRISVTRSGDDIVLSQEQFRLLEPGDGSWKVPVLYRTPSGDGRVLVEEEPAVIEGAESIVVNAGGEGFYRVAYGDELRPVILDGLTELPAIERFAVVSDAVANMLKGDLSGAEYLSLAAMLSDENDKDVWSVALSGISELDRVISEDGRPALEDYVTGLVSGKAGELGWRSVDGESDRTRSMRNLLLKALGNLGEDAETIDTARSIYAADDAPDAEIADAALGIVAAHGDAGTFAELIAKSDDAPTPQLKVKYLRAATQVADPDSARKLFAMVLDGDVRSQDSYWVLALLVGHRHNGPLIWNLITENWEATLASMPPQNGRRLLDLIHFRSEPDVAASIREWFVDHTITGGETYTRQQLELLQVRVGLRSRESHALAQALRDV
ncbi:Membrane alanine aminopeptidase N [hydrothermal vent metagenome]|uniref:Membrane alanine aminopeptidase N n=1 Tax=hydrothermal vent metagenome TaxID=652676 RepID=A0A3B0RB27_9ZZZZ